MTITLGAGGALCGSWSWTVSRRDFGHGGVGDADKAPCGCWSWTVSTAGTSGGAMVLCALLGCWVGAVTLAVCLLAVCLPVAGFGMRAERRVLPRATGDV